MIKLYGAPRRSYKLLISLDCFSFDFHLHFYNSSSPVPLELFSRCHFHMRELFQFCAVFHHVFYHVLQRLPTKRPPFQLTHQHLVSSRSISSYSDWIGLARRFHTQPSDFLWHHWFANTQWLGQFFTISVKLTLSIWRSTSHWPQHALIRTNETFKKNSAWNSLWAHLTDHLLPLLMLYLKFDHFSFWFSFDFP